MSNIGKLKIHIPSSLKIVKTDFDLNFFTLKFIGNLGTISINLPKSIIVNITGDIITLESDDKVMWGTSRNLIKQAIIGVSTGYTKKLEVIGIGYKITFNNNVLTFYLGKSHPVQVPVIDLIKVNLVNSTTITATSISIPLLTNYLHRIRQIKPATKDHYKGKGIRVI